MDARGGQQVEDVLVPGAPALTQVVGQPQEQLAPHHLVPVHVGHVLEFGFHCRVTRDTHVRQSERGNREKDREIYRPLQTAAN